MYRLSTRTLVLFTAIAILLTALPGVGSAAQFVYFNEFGGNGGPTPRGFYNFDTATRISTLRAEVDLSATFFSMDRRPSDGQVFAINRNDHSLYTVDFNTGTYSFATALKGSGDLSLLLSIAFDPTSGVLYGMEHNGGGLSIIDPLSGQVTPIGPTSGGIPFAGLAFSPTGVLYATESNTLNRLFTIDPGSGTVSLVGGGSNARPEAATFAPDGSMYVSIYGGNIFQYDLKTGFQTFVANIGRSSGMIALISVPEPASIAMGLMGAAALGAVVIRKRRARV